MTHFCDRFASTRHGPEASALAPPFSAPDVLKSVGYLPVLVDDLAVVSHTYGEVAGYDAATLVERWRFPLKTPYQRSLPYRGAVAFDGTNLLVNDGGELVVLKVADGRPQGRYRIPEFDLQNGVPLSKGLVTPSYRERKFTIGLYPAGDYDHAAWTVPTFAPTRPAAATDAICVFPRTRSELVAVEIASGTELWSHSVAELGGWEDASGSRVRGDLAAAPIITDSLVITGVTGNRVLALRLSDGTVVWQREVDVLTPSNLTLDAGGTLHLPGHPTYYQFEAATGQVIAHLDVKSHLEAIGITLLNQADVSTTHVFSSGSNGLLFAMDRATGLIAWSWHTKGQPAVTLYPIAAEGILWYLDGSGNLLHFRALAP